MTEETTPIPEQTPVEPIVEPKVEEKKPEPVRTNPNGANGTTSDPREQIMWDFYVAKIANGIENAYESAIEAGYSEDHSRNITLQGWFKERVAKLRRKEMLSKAERNLDKTLDLITVNKEGHEDSQLLKIKVDVSKTIVSTLGKNEGYSTRNELTGANGKELFTGLSDEDKAKLDALINAQ